MNIETTVSTAMGELALGDTFTFDELVSAVQRRRERPLRIVELADLSDRHGLCALWLERDSADLVVHAHTESPLHRQQFVLHELAHMILDHGDNPDLDAPDQLLPDISVIARRRLLARHDLDSEAEILAEALADHLAAAIRGSVTQQSKFVEIFG